VCLSAGSSTERRSAAVLRQDGRDVNESGASLRGDPRDVGPHAGGVRDSQPRGTVSGTARIEVRDEVLKTMAGPATVTMRQGHRLVARSMATSGRNFALSAPPGSYEISLHCPLPIPGAPIVVRANQSSQAAIHCVLD
jgi:hypothetical protein